MIILLAVLALVVVQALAESPWGVFTIAMTIPVALIMGIGLRTGKVNVMAITIFGLLGLAFGVWGGQFLAHFPAIEAWFRHDQKWLAWAIMIYGLAASILPVWMLLTPRDYLSTFLKLGTVAMLAAARGADPPDIANAGDHKIHRRQWPRICRPSLSLCMYHDRLRRGLRFSFSHCLGHNAENAATRVPNTQYRLWRDGDRNDGCFDGDDRRVRAATGRIFRD